MPIRKLSFSSVTTFLHHLFLFASVTACLRMGSGMGQKGLMLQDQRWLMTLADRSSKSEYDLLFPLSLILTFPNMVTCYFSVSFPTLLIIPCAHSKFVLLTLSQCLSWPPAILPGLSGQADHWTVSPNRCILSLDSLDSSSDHVAGLSVARCTLA